MFCQNGETMRRTDEFIAKAQSEPKVVADWKYDYGASDEECATMLLMATLAPDLGQRIDGF